MSTIMRLRFLLVMLAICLLPGCSLFDGVNNSLEYVDQATTYSSPCIAKGIHEQLISYNETLMKEINGYLEKINNGAIDLKSIANSQMVETITKITGILDQVKKPKRTEQIALTTTGDPISPSRLMDYLSPD